ncbi:hypothetical protein AVEN_195748-1 [Araneus ventricosus]|uniref:Uncharacterized protein n=1 Tax=Araneus ventricosus TaxID=182803 RepID=A0A4Y2X6W1_ARAVE|nr:hypothetical protein AVEN_195748-1 [Araneus ventricosus]
MCHPSSLLPVKVIEEAASTKEVAGIFKFLPRSEAEQKINQGSCSTVWNSSKYIDRYCNKYEEFVKSSVLPSSVSDLPGPIEETAFISVPEVQSSSAEPVSTSNIANLWVEFDYAKPRQIFECKREDMLHNTL